MNTESRLNPTKKIRIAMVVGEESGDILGAGLIKSLRAHHPDIEFEGIGGPRMIAEGFYSHYAMDRLAVMGLVEPLKRLPELLGIRRQLKKRYLQNPPDVFIGIDAPDFNLGLEESLHGAGVFTVHYVSPSVWAWRQGRVKRIARSVDLMLTLFPFEAKFYESNQVNVEFVGHPLADAFPIEASPQAARQKLGLAADSRYIALLPGSRKTEVEKLGHDFLKAASLCHKQDASLKFLMPAANEARYQQIQEILQEYASLPVTLSLKNSHDVMAAADVVLMASGTTTLEAMLLKRPMVIAYRVASVSYWILKRLVKSAYIGLPNLLANKQLVPELIQEDAKPELIAEQLMLYLQQPGKTEELQKQYHDIHLSIKKNASDQAAMAILNHKFGASENG